MIEEATVNRAFAWLCWVAAWQNVVVVRQGKAEASCDIQVQEHSHHHLITVGAYRQMILRLLIAVVSALRSDGRRRPWPYS